jgi:hypothetical protein
MAYQFQAPPQPVADIVREIETRRAVTLAPSNKET